MYTYHITVNVDNGLYYTKNRRRFTFKESDLLFLLLLSDLCFSEKSMSLLCLLYLLLSSVFIKRGAISPIFICNAKLN